MRGTHGRRRAVAALLFVVAGLVPGSVRAAGPPPDAGPLHVSVSPDLRCTVTYDGQPDVFFGDGSTCGTAVAVDDAVYAPSGGEVAAYNFTPVAQTVDSDGGGLRITTIVDAGATGVRITEIDRLPRGATAYETRLRIENRSGRTRSIIAYRAADCFAGDEFPPVLNALGFGALDGGDVACITAVHQPDDSWTRGTGSIRWHPTAGAARRMEGEYETVADAIAAARPLPGTCECETATDNGAGVSWSLTLRPAHHEQVRHDTIFTAPFEASPPPHPRPLPRGEFTCRASAVRTAALEPVVANDANDPCASDDVLLADVQIGLLTTNAAHATTHLLLGNDPSGLADPREVPPSVGDQAEARAGVALLEVHLPGVTVVANDLEARASVACGPHPAAGSHVGSLAINGTVIAVPPGHQDIAVPGVATIHLSEVLNSPGGITSRALWIQMAVPGVPDVVAGEASAGDPFHRCFSFSGKARFI